MASSKKKTEHKPSPVSAAWEQSYATYLSGRAVLDGVDALAQDMERHWGVDRLRLLVSTETREKFDRQRFKLNAAIMHGDLQDVIREGQRMLLAWRFADAEASRDNQPPLSKQVWEVATADGTAIAIVPTTAQAALVQANGRRMAIYTLEEVANLLLASEAVLKAKLQWPGAEVVRVRTPRDPLKNIPARAMGLDDHDEDLDEILRGTPLGRH